MRECRLLRIAKELRHTPKRSIHLPFTDATLQLIQTYTPAMIKGNMNCGITLIEFESDVSVTVQAVPTFVFYHAH